MNIILIHTHDTGRYISPYGYSAKTKNLVMPTARINPGIAYPIERKELNFPKKLFFV